MELFFYRKYRGIYSWSIGLGRWTYGPRVHRIHYTRAVSDWMYDQDLIGRRGMFPSNRDRRSNDERLQMPKRATTALTTRRRGAMVSLVGARGVVTMGPFLDEF
jgi:hypothetical protein